MRPRLLIAALLFGATGCSWTGDLREASFDTLIVGTWAEVVAPDGRILFANTYFPDGRIHSYGYDVFDPDHFWSATGRWAHEDGRNCLEIEHSTTPGLPVGDRWCNRVVSIDERNYTFESEGGERVTMWRVSDGRVSTSR